MLLSVQRPICCSTLPPALIQPRCRSTVYDAFKQKLVAAARTLKMGNPQDESVIIGPLISEKEAIRLESWINRAKEKGARVLCGGRRDCSLLSATLLENVPIDEPVRSQEAFGPVAVLESFDHLFVLQLFLVLFNKVSNGLLQ